jgi:hypothetical protein
MVAEATVEGGVLILVVRDLASNICPTGVADTGTAPSGRIMWFTGMARGGSPPAVETMGADAEETGIAAAALSSFMARSCLCISILRRGIEGRGRKAKKNTNHYFMKERER